MIRHLLMNRMLVTVVLDKILYYTVFFLFFFSHLHSKVFGNISYTFSKMSECVWMCLKYLLYIDLYMLLCVQKHKHSIHIFLLSFFLQLPPPPSPLYLALGLLVRWAGRTPTILQLLTCFSFTISRVVMPWPLHSCFTSCSLTLRVVLLEFMGL